MFKKLLEEQTTLLKEYKESCTNGIEVYLACYSIQGKIDMLEQLLKETTK